MLENIENGRCNAQPQVPRYSLTDSETNTESEIQKLKKAVEQYKEIILDNREQIKALRDCVTQQQRLIKILEKMVKMLETLIPPNVDFPRASIEETAD